LREVSKKLQVRRFEVAVQTENFECLSQSVNDDRLNVDVPFVAPQIIPDVPESNASSLLHCKVKNLPDIPNPKFCLNPLLERFKSRSSKRIKSFWQNIRTCRLGLKYISSVPIEIRDPRPFLPVRLLDRTVYGLLDYGASISCFGGDLASELSKKDNAYKSLNVSATTADGSPQRIVGKMKVNIEYGNIQKILNIYIVPSLKQDLYLGIDFWRLYDLLPKNLHISELESKKSSKVSSNVEADQHDLSEAEKLRLVHVINSFPSFAQEGLGQTSLITHTVDVGSAKPVKQRHFPVSPAVQKSMYG